MNMPVSKIKPASKTKKIVLGASLLCIAASAWADPAPQRQAEIFRLLHGDCGACHGGNLNGGLGPALKSPNLDRLTVEAIKTTILNGRPGTPMPPWNPFLTDDEASWLAQQLKRGLDQ